MLRTIPIALLVVLAGCIAAPTPEEVREAAAIAPPADRVDGMTAESTIVDSTAACDDGGLQIPPGAFCAERIMTATGRIGLDRLPVDLETVNGGISIDSGDSDAWSFIATIKTRALTEDAARSGLDSAWTWGHERDGAHVLYAKPQRTPTLDALGATLESATYEIVLPGWLVLELVAKGTNGAIAVALDTDGLTAETTNGAIVLAGAVTDASLKTSNGAITAALTPARSGTITASTTNGAIAINVPEGREMGYDIEGRTTNGDVQILLEDGTVKESSESYVDKSASFRTDGYEARAVQTKMSLETTNGNIVVGA